MASDRQTSRGAKIIWRQSYPRSSFVHILTPIGGIHGRYDGPLSHFSRLGEPLYQLLQYDNHRATDILGRPPGPDREYAGLRSSAPIDTDVQSAPSPRFTHPLTSTSFEREPRPGSRQPPLIACFHQLVPRRSIRRMVWRHCRWRHLGLDHRGCV
jgi:hypothetical protein